MRFYAIRRKTDGAFFPGRFRRGQTAVEPEKGKPPRLFASKHAAASALKWWLEGVYVMHRGGSGYDGDYDETLHCEKMPERKAEDFDVVEVEIRVRVAAV